MKIGDKKSENGISYVWGKCKKCGKEKWMFNSSFLKYCSRKCWNISQSGENSHHWNGGTYIHKGYLRFSKKGLKGKLVHQHIMEDYLGRKLNKFERIHHIDGNKLNNSIENLVIIKQSIHARQHMKEIWNKRKCEN